MIKLKKEKIIEIEFITDTCEKAIIKIRKRYS